MLAFTVAAIAIAVQYQHVLLFSAAAIIGSETCTEMSRCCAEIRMGHFLVCFDLSLVVPKGRAMQFGRHRQTASYLQTKIGH